MSWMGFQYPVFLSFLLSMAEISFIGICLFLNIKLKTAAWGAILFMGFYSLTLVLAIKNPVTDCGCFGDALILTNWETFWKKNIILP